ncbi:MAG: YbhB/YbcL family Raf kinase inhibitor-like protein [Chloroflexi bacterium]|nr:YbhB/YbcL family Raf kinase inhibitor-like protein [Chloroflexota bacterium]
MGALILVLALAACTSGAGTTPAPEGQPPTAGQPQAEATSTAIDETLPAGPTASNGDKAFALQSPAFADGADIPQRFTCDGENLSPPLEWAGVPDGAGALMLVTFDPDAGRDLGASTDLGFVHWVVTDLPVASNGLPEGASSSAAALQGAAEADNDFAAAAGSTFPGGAVIRGTGYDGPCPPARHTYVFRLVALDRPLGLPGGTPASEAITAAEGRILGLAEWTGSYASAR